ncbi:hypothetical protein GFS31_05710 [Leptolyngbya sp. BL0902]|uniref:hypothetical protein n=1 Tax=Leptolyngbya sp. BL0902 TaxID=1115757 RepID=UPI0018E7FDCF|nr:hypothetical protein [Leptolyngbya sp. BL0902]QQE63900.1 hypothetical protein GFS31_05710 [Leptolyngbya sp. BL0902]
MVALAMGGGLKLWQHQQADPGATASAAASLADGSQETTAVSVDGSQPAGFPEPFLAATPDPADPTLLQSTPSQARVPTVAAGRPDPFSPLVIPAATPARPTPALVTAPPPPPVPMPAPAAAPSQPAGPPSLPTGAAAQSLPPLPTVTLSNLPAPPIPGGFPLLPEATLDTAPVVQSAVDQVTISGVVQIGQQVHAIVVDPGNPSGRRVSQGDTVAGGQVRIKTIDLSGVDPTVVLTYNGRDYFRSVGGAGSL